jgi:hypothetical protein
MWILGLFSEEVLQISGNLIVEEIRWKDQGLKFGLAWAQVANACNPNLLGY